MNQKHIIIGAAIAAAAVGVYLYKTRSKKAGTAAVQPSPMTSSGGVAVTSLKDAAARIASTFAAPSTAAATLDLDGDIATARAFDAPAELA